MKRTAIISIIVCLLAVIPARANESRIATFIIPDLIDDPINISAFPHQINLYPNYFWGDIGRMKPEAFGIIIMPGEKFGSFALWQTSRPITEGFNVGYARSVFNFDVGVSGMYLNDYKHFGVGLGRTYFSKRIDLSFLMNDETNNQWYRVNEHLLFRQGDFIIAERYSFVKNHAPYEYVNHKFAPIIQRMILNEGFVYLAAEYNNQSGSIETDYTDIFAGVELPLNRTFALRLGAVEHLNEDFIPTSYLVQPGISVRIREFNFDFLLNKNRFFDRQEPLINSFGLDLNYGRF